MSTPPFILAGDNAAIHAQRVAKMRRVVSTKVTRAAKVVGVSTDDNFLAVSPAGRTDDLLELAVPERVHRQAQALLNNGGCWVLVYQDGYISIVPDAVFRRDYQAVDPT